MPEKLEGRSGVKHEFDLVESNETEVTKIYLKPVDEVEVIKMRAQLLDLEKEYQGIIIAPSFTQEAEKLAKEYRIKLVQKSS